jgi:hypothetical protein
MTDFTIAKILSGILPGLHSHTQGLAMSEVHEHADDAVLKKAIANWHTTTTLDAPD